MFKNLRTSTKLILLCAMFLVSLGVTTYSLVAEKQIAIAFARKELVGTIYLASLRSIYAAVMAAPPIDTAAPAGDKPPSDPLRTLATAQDYAGAHLQTAEDAQALAGALRLAAGTPDGRAAYGFAQDALAKARALVARVADESNLALDPDLDSYYLQDLITRKLPDFLTHLAELQLLSGAAAAAGTPTDEQRVRLQVLEGLLRSVADEVRGNLASAYRGNPDGSVKQAVDGAFVGMAAHTNAYLGGLNASFILGIPAGRTEAAPGRLYGGALDGAIAAWAAAESELVRLLRKRIDGLVERMRLSLALTGALAALSIVIAFMTYRHIAQPLERLEQVASTVSETKDYSLRMDYASKNEIGRLAGAFNDMLAELAAARERERTDQSELARAARMNSMGAMTASIAHEINQPLAAIVANSNAAQRWLSNPKPDLDEALAALKNITRDGHRASQVIGGVRAMFRKDGRDTARLAVNDVIADILTLVQDEVRKQRVRVRTELLDDLPDVVGDRIQLLQVFMNLVRNAVEAMAPITNRERLLVVKSHVPEPGMVMVTVEDSGMGIDSTNSERVFDALFTTKPDGMGLGLSISRSIVEAHGGRLWATPGTPHGSAFHVVLPSNHR